LSGATLRPISEEDESFLINVYGVARAAELALVQWNDAQKAAFITGQFLAQRDHYQKHFPGAECSIVMVDDQPAGRFYVYRGQDEIRILDLTLLPEYRSRGAASGLVETLLAEAAQSNRRVRVYVETFNPSAAFFERRGFVKTEDDGINYLMIWSPSSEV